MQKQSISPSPPPPLTIERTMVLILFMLLFALATRIPLDTDTWWHLRAGQWMVENGQIISGDPFSHTRTGVVRVPADWGAQVILYSLWALAGDFGMALFTSGLATLGMWLLFRASDGNTYLRAFVIVLGAATAAVFWSARPQMFTFVLSAFVVYLLALYKRKHVDHLAWLVPIMLVWANLHGGYFIGLLLLYGTLAGEVLNKLLRSASPHVISGARLRKLALITLIGTAVVLINPAGSRLLLLPFETFTLGALRQFIQEWNPPNLTSPSVYPFNVLLIGVVVLLIAHWRKLDWTEAALIGGTSYLALTTSRNIAFFAVVATPILTYHLNTVFEGRGWVLKTVQRPTPRMIRLNRLLLALVAFGTFAKVVLVMDAAAIDTAKRTIFPLGAVEYLNATLPPQTSAEVVMFNSYNWGGYLMFHAPQIRVYIDGRTDLYGDFVLEYVKIAFAEDGWQTALEAQQITLIVVEVGSPLGQALANNANPNWQTVYRDDLALIAAIATRL